MTGEADMIPAVKRDKTFVEVYNTPITECKETCCRGYWNPEGGPNGNGWRETRGELSEEESTVIHEIARRLSGDESAAKGMYNVLVKRYKHQLVTCGFCRGKPEEYGNEFQKGMNPEGLTVGRKVEMGLGISMKSIERSAKRGRAGA